MSSQRRQHVIEKTDPGFDLVLSGSIEVPTHENIGFVGHAMNFGDAVEP
jgi:hypothetical protein